MMIVDHSLSDVSAVLPAESGGGALKVRFVGDSNETMRAQLARANRQLSATYDDLESSRRDVVRQEATIAALRHEIDDVNSRLQAARRETESLVSQNKAVQNQLMEARGARDTAQEQVAALEVEAAAEKGNVYHAQRQLEAAGKLVTNLQSQVEVLNEQIGSLRSRVAEAEEQRLVCSTETERYRHAMEELNNEVGQGIASIMSLISTSLVDGDSHMNRSNMTISEYSVSPGRSRSNATSAFPQLKAATEKLVISLRQASSNGEATNKSLQQLKEQAKDREGKLQAALAENATLSSRVVSLDEKLSRTSAELSHTKRETEGSNSTSRHRLESMAEALGCFAEWGAVEATCSKLVKEVNEQRLKNEELDVKLHQAKAQLEGQEREHEFNLRETAAKLRRESNEAQAKLAAKLDNALEQQQLLKHELFTATVKEEEGAAAANAATISPLKHLDGTPSSPLGKKYERALEHGKDVELSLQQAKAEAAQARSELATAHMELANLKMRASAESEDGRQHESAAAKKSWEDVVRLAVGALCGARLDLSELCWQRRVLSQATAAGLSSRSSRTLLLRFRAAAIAVIAANRLLRCHQMQKRQRKKLVWSARALGEPRFRLCPCKSSEEVGEGPLSLPSHAELIADPVAAINGLLQQVAIPCIKQKSVLVERLGYGLNRAIKATAASQSFTALRHLSPPLPRPTAVQQTLHTVSPPQQQQQYVPSSYPTIVFAKSDDGGGTPPPVPRLSVAAPRPVPVMSLRNSSSPPLPLEQTQQIDGSGVLVSQQQQQQQGASPASWATSDGFAVEVLNVIRALDSRIEGALSRASYNTKQLKKLPRSTQYR